MNDTVNDDSDRYENKRGIMFLLQSFFLLHVFVSLFELVFKNLANGAEYSFVFFCLNFLFA